ncbi:MAG: LPP20 family lipoprotein [Burkholderiaceae bacterium]|nr:LPP20 family lipoprotein [Burkholderiaceae bacterium]
MNKMSKCSTLTLALLMTACQAVPTVAVADNASAKAEAKAAEVKPVPLPEPKAPEVRAEVKSEVRAPEAKAEARPAAREDAVSMITPMAERAATIRATGYAVISTQNHKNPAQQRLMAIRASKLDAYRALTEQVYGQQLDATTTVAEMMITSDTFRTRVQGIIYGAVLESITPIGDDTYETTLSLDGRVVNDLRVLYLAQLAARHK